MAEGLITLAEHGQVNVITPFTLAGAMSPVTLAGALAQQHAEAMAGIVLTQIVRPGVPVMYGGFTSNVDMRSGAPAFGTPEYTQGRAGHRPARAPASACPSARPMSPPPMRSMRRPPMNRQMALWGAVMGGAHLVLHAAGWLHGGLTASFEKLILDAEMLQMMAAYLQPIRGVRADALPSRRSARSGRAGISSARPIRSPAMRPPSIAPLLSNWDNHRRMARARRDDGARAGPMPSGSSCSANIEQPPIDPAIDEALRDFMERRKREGGAPANCVVGVVSSEW